MYMQGVESHTVRHMALLARPKVDALKRGFNVRENHSTCFSQLYFFMRFSLLSFAMPAFTL